MQYLRDVSEMSCGTTAIIQMRLQQDSSNSSRIVRITATSKFLDVIFISSSPGKRHQEAVFKRDQRSMCATLKLSITDPNWHRSSGKQRAINRFGVRHIKSRKVRGDEVSCTI